MKWLLLSLVFIISCSPKKDTVKEVPSEYDMICSRVRGNLIRCENKEVICYGGNGGYLGVVVGEAGVSCKFKEKKDEVFVITPD